MSPAERSARLRELADDYGLGPRTVAEIAGVAPTTAKAWLRPPTNRAHRSPPLPVLRLVALHLGADL